MTKIHNIYSYFHPPERSVLTTAAQPVSLTDINSQGLQNMIDDMMITMRQANGVGLAAPQIGQSVRVAVVTRLDTPRQDPYVLINPMIDRLSPKKSEDEEGCLSIPGVYGLTPRHISLRLKAFDRHGQPYEMLADHLLARIIQHELDHLNGRLFITRVTSFTRGEELLKP